MSKKRAQLSVSLFSADFLHIGQELEKINHSTAVSLHIDVMDGKFVELYGINQNWLNAARTICSLPVDVHFMTELSRERIERFLVPGVQTVTVHVEAARDPQLREALAQIHEAGRRAGLAISPDTETERLLPYLDDVEEVLVLTGQPGKPGAHYQPETLEKLRHISRIGGGRFLTAVDGGIDEKTAVDCINAGAGKLIIGRSFFRDPGAFAELSM